MFVRLADGELRNAFTVRILNKSLETRSFVLTVDGLTDIDLKVVGDTVATGRHRGGRGRPRPDPRGARAGQHLSDAAAGGLDSADVPHHRSPRPGGRPPRSTISAGHEVDDADTPLDQRTTDAARER